MVSKKLVLILIVAVFLLILPACSKPSAKIIGEWIPEASQKITYIGPGIIGNIGGKNYLFARTASNIPDMRNGLLILDLQNPDSPEQVSYLTAPEAITGLELAGTVLYASLGESLWIIDVSHPSAPSEIARLTDIKATRVSISGKYAYIFGGEKITVADISDSASPQIVGSLVNMPAPVKTVISDSTLVYLSYDLVIHLIDISSPQSLKEVSVFPSPGYASLPLTSPQTITPGQGIQRVNKFFDLASSGKYIYIAAGTDGMRVFDISNPAIPKEVANFSLEESKTNQVSGAGTILILQNWAYLYVGIDSVLMIEIIDISDPYNPKELSSIRLPTGDFSHPPTYNYNGSVGIDNKIYNFARKRLDNGTTSAVIQIIDVSSK